MAFGQFEKMILIVNNCVKNVPIRRFFWSVFSYIQTEYGEILSISPYSVQMRKNTDQKKLPIWTLYTQQIPVYTLKDSKIS